MPSPFRGMDPHLEGRTVWRDLHDALVVGCRDTLASQVARAYYIAIEERTYIMEVEDERLVGHPDLAIVGMPPPPGPGSKPASATAAAVAPEVVTLPLLEEVRETYLEIHDARTHEVITVIEVLSPTNKAPGVGRREYQAKRQQVLLGITNLVEVDLLRAGEPMEMHPRPASDYRILVRAGWERPIAHLYRFSVRQPIPEVPVPLRQREAAAHLAIGELLPGIYDRARYDIRLDYAQPPDPPLASEDAAWADELLRAAGLRRA